MVEDPRETDDLSGRVLNDRLTSEAPAGGVAKKRETKEAPTPLGRRGFAREGRLLAGRYRLLTLLGRGGMGVVMLAHDLEADRDVAVKLLLAGEIGGQQAERFRREGELAAAVKHPGVVRVHAAGIGEDERPYLVYELVEGAQTLAEAGRRLGLEARVELIAQAAQALGAAHRAGIVHRDVKPENILVDPAGRARVTDFGAALQGELSRLTVSGGIVGTPAFMAPEQLLGGDVTPATDVWALGVCLYETVCGVLPFPAESLPELFQKVERGSFTAPSSVEPSVSPALNAVILRCLRSDPGERYADGAAVAAALATVFNPRAARGLWWGVAITGAALLVGAVVAGTWAEVPAAPAAPASRPSASRSPSESGSGTPAPNPSRSAESTPAPRSPLRVFKVPAVRAAVWAQGGERIVACSDRGVALWDAATHREIGRWSAGIVFEVAVSPQGDRIAFGGTHRVVTLVDARDGAVQRRIKFEATINSLRFRPHGNVLAIGGALFVTRLWDLSGTGSVNLPTVGDVHTLAWSRDGRYLATAGRKNGQSRSQNLVRVWDLQGGGQLLTSTTAVPGRVHRIEFHPARPVLYLGDAVGGVLEIPLAGGGTKRFVSEDASTPLVERAHRGRVFWIEVGPEGRRIVSASGGRSFLPNSAGVRVWDVETRRVVLARTRSDPVLSVALSPDRKHVLLAVGGKGQVEVWPADDLFR